MHNFKIVNADTDSISFCKEDESPFTQEEQERFLQEVNALFPSRIHWESEGVFNKIIVVKAKNYILWDGKKLKHKGSAIKASTKEPALKKFIKDVIDTMLHVQVREEIDNKCIEIYQQYAREIMNIEDINRWATRKTITANVLNAKRTNEQKVLTAISGSELVEGDRAHFYFKEDGSLMLATCFDGLYDRDKLLEKLFKTANIFSTVLDTKTMFPNYKLKKNKPLLNDLLLEMAV